MTDAAGSIPGNAPAQGSVRGRWPAVVLCSVLALVLLGLGLPRTIAAWSSIEGFKVFDALTVGTKPSDNEIADAIAGLESALAWVPSGTRYDHLASAEFELYRRYSATDPARASGFLARSEQHAIAAIKANPGDGNASMLLATIRLVRRAPPRDIAAPVLQSIDVMPNMRQAWPWRTTLLLAVWSVLTPDERLAMSAHLRTIWITDPKMRRQLVVTATATGQLETLAKALANEPGALDEFEKLTAQHKPGADR